MPRLCLKSPAILHSTKTTPQTTAAPTTNTDELSDDSSKLSSIELMSSTESTPWETPAPVPPAALSCQVSKRIQFKQPTGAGRKNLAELVDWDAELMVFIKVNQLYIHRLNCYVEPSPVLSWGVMSLEIIY
jgi:hypothetical protein